MQQSQVTWERSKVQAPGSRQVRLAVSVNKDLAATSEQAFGIAPATEDLIIHLAAAVAPGCRKVGTLNGHSCGILDGGTNLDKHLRANEQCSSQCLPATSLAGNSVYLFEEQLPVMQQLVQQVKSGCISSVDVTSKRYNP